jgi:hypothetical protein
LILYFLSLDGRFVMGRWHRAVGIIWEGWVEESICNGEKDLEGKGQDGIADLGG